MEILNIDYNIKILIIKALNSSRTNRVAHVKLGISVKALYNYIRQYNIKYNKNTHAYEQNIPKGSSSIKV